MLVSVPELTMQVYAEATMTLTSVADPPAGVNPVPVMLTEYVPVLVLVDWRLVTVGVRASSYEKRQRETLLKSRSQPAAALLTMTCTVFSVTGSCI